MSKEAADVMTSDTFFATDKSEEALPKKMHCRRCEEALHRPRRRFEERAHRRVLNQMSPKRSRLGSDC